MAQRLIVFLDEQNVYRGARRAFFQEGSESRLGNINPVLLGELLTSRRPSGDREERILVEVRVYTAFPDATRDEKGYAAYRRRSQRWQDLGAVVVDRPLRYPRGWPAAGQAQQKGVDVALALDFVTHALAGAYDVGILFSLDTDLRPAIAYVAEKTDATAETASWWSEKSPSRLSIPGLRTWNHRLERNDYDAVADLSDYKL